MSKKAIQRQTRKEKRRKARQRQQILTISIVTGLALIFAALLIYPSVRPIGEIVEITPIGRQNADGLAIGDANAPILIEIFEDFQCPACRSFTENIEPTVVANYVDTGLARLIYRQNPFIGRESFQAANASMCANEQGRFWDYHDILFANQTGENIGAFSDRRLQAFAESLNLDMELFNECFQRNKYENNINEDLALSRGYGIRGTPTVVVNGQPLSSFTLATIQTAVDEAVAELVE